MSTAKRLQVVLDIRAANGTPDTLRQAIDNGIAAGGGVDPEIMELHFRDFVAQKFTTAMIEGWSLEATFKAIVKK